MPRIRLGAIHVRAVLELSRWGAAPHPGRPRCAPTAHRLAFATGSLMTTQTTETLPAIKRKGGRPKGDPAALRGATIGVRVSADEYAVLRDKAAQMHMPPGRWLREAALKRQLPAPPVAAINRAQYVELARLSANLNQLTHHANAGKSVVIADALLHKLITEVAGLRLGLLGIKRPP